MNTATPTAKREIQWLRSQEFDMVLIVGILFLGVFSALLAVAQPALLWPIIIINLWLFGYHHVVATYTRLCFDKESFKQSRFLIFGLAPIVVIATLAVMQFIGLWAIFTIYFYWQWWHYSRQSWGVSRAYRGKDRTAKYENGYLDQAIFYALPITGLIYRSYQDQDQFLGTDLVVLPVPFFMFAIAAIITLGLLIYWVTQRFRAHAQGKLATAHTLYIASHFTIYAVAYIFINDLTTGWLAINIWHNTQYILFVYLFNSNRFKNGVEPDKKFLSYISQQGRMPLYLGVCLLITFAFYIIVLNSLQKSFLFTATTGLVVYQMVNYHHYIVDSFIWKMKKPAIRKNVGITN